jgi:enamine deaminase RidA (YjgF/YER057c/UK114 family)
MKAEQRLVELGFELPPPAKPAGLYRPTIRCGDLLFVSGHGPYQVDGSLLTGKVGQEVDLEGGRRAARATALAVLSTLRSEIGSLDRIERLVKTLGLVNAVPDFRRHPAVIDAFSEVMAQVFGEERGVGARSAVGVASLPADITVEVEAIFALAD